MPKRRRETPRERSSRKRPRIAKSGPFTIIRKGSGRKARHNPTTDFRPNYLPEKTITKLEYHNEQVISLTTGAGQAYVFRGNSLFDPNFTGTGGQPTGFDQLAAKYNLFRVHGSKITARFINTSSSEPAEILLMAHKASTLASFNDAARMTKRQLPALLGTSGGGHDVKTLGGYRGTREVMGLSKRQYGDIGYSAGVTGNPTREWYWHLWARNIDQFNTIAVNVQVHIKFYCEFYEPKIPVAS